FIAPLFIEFPDKNNNVTEPNVLLSRLLSCHSANIAVMSSHVLGESELNLRNKLYAKMLTNDTGENNVIVLTFTDSKPKFFKYDLNTGRYVT
ncbi:MAG: hypothetical protein KDJ36_17710, partial [Hyphomicrobiaceae bacterium]|nr:hypothetical protein [Hyphomicrobiaceae bacterium]